MPPNPTPNTHDRITFGTDVVFEHERSQPEGFNSRAYHYLENREQAYIRKKLIKEDLTPLEAGWISNPGSFWIKNRAGEGKATNPSPEEKELDKKRVLRIYLDEGSQPLMLYPGEAMYLRVGDLSRVRICSDYQNLEVPVTQVLFSK